MNNNNNKGDDDNKTTILSLLESTSIHPSILWGLSGPGGAGSRLSKELQAPSPQQRFPVPPGGPRGVPRPAGICNPSSQLWVYPLVSYQLDVPGKPPRGGVLIRRPNRLNWLLSTPRSSGSTLSSLRMSELLLYL